MSIYQMTKCDHKSSIKWPKGVYGIKSKKHIIIEGVAVVHKMGMVHSLQIIVMNSFDIHCDDNNTEKRRKKILEQLRERSL